MPTLQWLTRDDDIKAAARTEYRLLVENETLSYGDPEAENLIVQGDNLEALKALLPFYAGQVKCIYIDPPYNTGSAFKDYDNNIEHSIWLSLIYPRLELLKQFIREDGVIFVQIDDAEHAYLKVVIDEIFGRNKTDCMVWRKSGAGRDGKMKNTTTFRKDHEYIIVAFKGDKKLNKSIEKPVWENSYPNPDNDPRGSYKAGSISRREDASNPNHKNYYTVTSPNGKSFTRQFDVSKEEFDKLNSDNRIYWGKNLDSVPAIKIFEEEERETNTSSLILSNGTSTEGKKEIEELFGNINAFETPKPENLLKKIIQISTKPGDLVLDSFLGSGTTAAVAHKMGRKYIGIEMGEHAKTHCAVRLKKVIDGEQGGISKAVSWKGGGGFRFFKLGDAVFDSERRIKPDISYENLAAHIYFSETKTPMKKPKKKSAFLGVHNDTAYALLYNGILGDKRINGGNVLTNITLNKIMNDIDAAAKKKGEPLQYNKMVIYGEATRLPFVSLESNNIIFKQTPYDIKVW